MAARPTAICATNNSAIPRVYLSTSIHHIIDRSTTPRPSAVDHEEKNETVKLVHLYDELNLNAQALQLQLDLHVCDVRG